VVKSLCCPVCCGVVLAESLLVWGWFLFVGRQWNLVADSQWDAIAEVVVYSQFVQAALGWNFGRIGFPFEHAFQVFVVLLDPHAALVVPGRLLGVHAGGLVPAPLRICRRTDHQILPFGLLGLGNNDFVILAIVAMAQQQ